MADGMTKRPGEPPILQECRWCAGTKGAYHACAFLAGKFDSSNWCCGALEQLELYAAVVEGDELDCLVVESPDGSMVVLTRRAGQPQRYRTALYVSPKGVPQRLTLEHVEHILDRRW